MKFALEISVCGRAEVRMRCANEFAYDAVHEIRARVHA